MIVEVDAQADPHGAAAQQGTQAMRCLTLDMHDAILTGLQRHGDVARIDPIGLDWHHAGRGFQVTSIQANDRQAKIAQSTVERCRQRSGLQPDQLARQILLV